MPADGRWDLTRRLRVKMSFNPYPANVENMVSSKNASKWQMGFNSAFKRVKIRV